MKERPILFNTEMVQAIRGGRKTQTRRPIKHDLIVNMDTDKHDKDYLYVQDEYGDGHHILEYAPCKVGDYLYVRETWQEDPTGYSDYNDIGKGRNLDYPKVFYKATPPRNFMKNKLSKWHPSIHMPKVYARIWLEVTNVRVERLQDITEGDAKAEGITREAAYECNGWIPSYNDPDSGGYPDYVMAYSYLWDSIYAKRGYGWESNPWVWVYEFKRKRG